MEQLISFESLEGAMKIIEKTYDMVRLVEPFSKKIDVLSKRSRQYNRSFRLGMLDFLAARQNLHELCFCQGTERR
ncbi:MAG: hypothetical protein QMC95_17115 [Desulfitobacteriaceae bacterium]|nr:hypothetical protein [Desulfitobacteriaceae bacterium]MDI6915908.1 hypothetical protein [Desulfitobacteriaceae bacterium]